MSLFLKKILLFSLCLFATDKLFTPLIFLTPELTPDKRLEEIINGDLSKEIIILGSSRGARNIIAGQIEEKIDKSVYNLSYPGSNAEFHSFILQTLIHFDQGPEYLLLVLDEPNYLYERDRMRFRYDVLYPLTKYHYINNQLIKRGEANGLAYFMVLSRIYRQSFDFSNWNFNPLDTILPCGSMPISFTRKDYNFKEALNTRTNETYNFDLKESPLLRDSFNKIVDNCRKNNIELILIYPPNFHVPDLQFIEKMNTIVGIENNYQSFNTKNPLYYDSTYYYDIGHLNSKGANFYTDEIIEFLIDHAGK